MPIQPPETQASASSPPEGASANGRIRATAATAIEPERLRRRRLGAYALLAVGIALAATQLGGSTPQDQTVVFRLPRGSDFPLARLDASFTRAGEREPSGGVSVTFAHPPPAEIRERVRLPNGDYIVALELTSIASAGPSAPTKTETSRARRVTLAGEETLVVFDAEGSD